MRQGKGGPICGGAYTRGGLIGGKILYGIKSLFTCRVVSSTEDGVFSKALFIICDPINIGGREHCPQKCAPS